MRLTIILFCVFWAPISAGQTLKSFSNGTVANADDINSNFQALKSAIDSKQSNVVLPRDRQCTQDDLVGQWYQTKGVPSGFEVSISNFYPSGQYILQVATFTATGEREDTITGSYVFNPVICGFDLSITNLPSAGFGVMNLDKSVMKLTTRSTIGEFGDFTLILISETPDNSLPTAAARESSASSTRASGTGRSFKPSDFVPAETIEQLTSARSKTKEVNR